MIGVFKSEIMQCLSRRIWLTHENHDNHTIRVGGGGLRIQHFSVYRFKPQEQFSTPTKSKSNHNLTYPSFWSGLLVTRNAKCLGETMDHSLPHKIGLIWTSDCWPWIWTVDVDVEPNDHFSDYDMWTRYQSKIFVQPLTCLPGRLMPALISSHEYSLTSAVSSSTLVSAWRGWRGFSSSAVGSVFQGGDDAIYVTFPWDVSFFDSGFWMELPCSLS